jgi:phospholipid/cholesterol/gamma-HCH transport system substrate-binding protein
LRELIVNLNIIATKLERDPAGFVFDSKNGYRPK